MGLYLRSAGIADFPTTNFEIFLPGVRAVTKMFGEQAPELASNGGVYLQVIKTRVKSGRAAAKFVKVAVFHD
jgi:ribosomal protein L17